MVTDGLVRCIFAGRPLEVFINININDISSISEMLMVSRFGRVLSAFVELLILNGLTNSIYANRQYISFVFFFIEAYICVCRIKKIIAFLARSDTSAGNSLFVPQFTAVRCHYPVFLLTSLSFLK